MMLSAPGSLLLTGEYRITEEGGTGITLAAGGRARLSIPAPEGPRSASEARSPELRALGPAGLAPMPLNASPDGSLAAVLNILGDTAVLPNRDITLDTRAFYTETGRKLGYGSSAAAVLLLTAALSPEAGRDTVRQALTAHRLFQNGRGSGYDILTSASGGVGLFTGGTSPQRRLLSWPEDLGGLLFRGPKSVSSGPAVKRWQELKTTSPERTGELIRQSDSLTKILSDAACSRNIPQILDTVKDAARLGAVIGSLISLPARIPSELPGGIRTESLQKRPETALKCLGAGDETVLLLYTPDGLTRREQDILNREIQSGNAHHLQIETRGLTRETD